MNSKTVTVPAISCEHCVSAIEEEVGGLGGVVNVEAAVDTKQVLIEWDAPADWERISMVLDEIGYPAAAN